MSANSSRMPRLDVGWLDGLGYGALDEPQKHLVLRAAYSALQLKIGTAISRSLPNELIGRFENILSDPRQDIAESQSIRFLEDNFPGYRDTVNLMFQQLTDELRLIRAEFDDLQKSRGRPVGAENLLERISPSPMPGISDMSHMESTDDAPSGADLSDPQVQGGTDV